MKRSAFVTVALAFLLSGPAAGQMPEDYLDVYIAKVKPEKTAEFNAVAKKMAEANRQHKGNTWLASETIYGETNTVSFITLSASYAQIEKQYELFVGAINKAYGPAGAGKLFLDFNNCLTSSRAEVRRRRWDLSANSPADPAAMAKRIAMSRWIRTVIVRVRPGHVLNIEAQLKAIKEAAEKGGSRTPTFVSQAVAGQQGTVFYISVLESSLGGFDTAPPLAQVLGEEGFLKFLKTAAESILGTETIINRFVPEISNPPEEVASVAPEFWRPKPAPPARRKPAAAGKPTS